MDVPLFMQTFVNRSDDFALQRNNGLYYRVGHPLTTQDVRKHLAGQHTIGVYVTNERGLCSYAVFDSDDTEHGLAVLCQVQDTLATRGVVSYLEQSRRAGHLWVFFTAPVDAARARAWLHPYCPTGMELYPKQDIIKRYGSVIRLPFGVHHRSGKRYPFVVQRANSETVPVAATISEAITWLATIERVTVPDVSPRSHVGPVPHKKTSFSLPVMNGPTQRDKRTIREWCAMQDPFMVIGRSVDLDRTGVGQCPFSWHHPCGQDTRASFKVYRPGVPGGYCWYCYTWQQGGSVFDFLRYFYNLDARSLWQRIQGDGVLSGER